MKKLLCLLAFVITVISITQCRTSKSGVASRKLSYTSDIQPIIVGKCTPCHFPDKGGRVEALNNYASVKGHIDEIITRIQLNPGEKGYMPFKKPKLSDSTINVFKQWKADGLGE